MSKPTPNRKKKKEIVDAIAKLLAFMDDNLPKFLNEFPHNKKKAHSMNENTLTEALVFFLVNTARTEEFSFMQQTTQEGKRTVDIGVFLFGNQLNYIFCIEAKFLPHSPFDYITGEYAAIKRFKANEHGLNNSIEKIPLSQNGIIAYVKSGTFDEHFLRINEKIQELALKHSLITDEFGLTWDNSEQLEKIYFRSIAKLISKHTRKKASYVSLYHFWIYIHKKTSLTNNVPIVTT